MEPPVEPDVSDCCNSGCNPCILDVYEEQLKKYKQRTSTCPTPIKNSISPTSYTVFKLVKLEKLTEQSFLFTFEYNRPYRGTKESDVALTYKPGQHFLLKATIHGEDFTRAYTPIPMENQTKLQFTTLIKLCDHGKMCTYLKRLPLEADTLWRGPYGDFTINYDIKHMLLVAQGTGLAPIYSIIHTIINNEDCCTFLKLFFCCNDSNSIYLREQLYKLSKYWNFTYEVFLSRPQGAIGKYNEVIHPKRLERREFETYLQGKVEDVNVLICGSENFMYDMKQHVLASDMKETDVFTF